MINEMYDPSLIAFKKAIIQIDLHGVIACDKK